MPIIRDFVCGACSHAYEVLKMKDSDENESCPECDAEPSKQKQKLTAPALFSGLDFQTPRSTTRVIK